MVEIEDLRFGYRKTALFEGLSLHLEPGNIYGLLGRNGAGKTSLLRLMAGQLFREEGGFSVLSCDPGDRDPRMLADIYYLPEEYFVPAVRPREYVSMYSPFYPGFDVARFEELQQEFQLTEAQKLSEYSYGQKKKFLIAFGLATKCSLVLFDEPTNGLDIPSKSQFRRIVASSIGETQTFVISTHQVRDMENLIDPIIVVDGGIIIFSAAMQEVADKLIVQKNQSVPDDPSILYSEKVLGGYRSLVLNEIEGDTAIDLELLFNGVVDEGGKVRGVFNQGEIK